MKNHILFLFISLFLISCSARFACKDVVDIEGEKCDPISVVYEKKMLGDEKTIEKEKDKQKDKKVKKDKEIDVSFPSEEVEVVRNLLYEEEKPVRLPPRVIRIWIAPWEDSDGDLHQPSYIYSEISPKKGRWLFGEKEITTGQPVIRPIEKPSDEQKPPGERKEESDMKKENKKVEERRNIRERQGDTTRLPALPDNQ